MPRDCVDDVDITGAGSSYTSSGQLLTRLPNSVCLQHRFAKKLRNDVELKIQCSGLTSGLASLVISGIERQIDKLWGPIIVGRASLFHIRSN